jgi:hypothetical protein
MSILGAILPDLRLKGFYEHTVGLLALFTPDPSSNRQQSFEVRMITEYTTHDLIPELTRNNASFACTNHSWQPCTVMTLSAARPRVIRPASSNLVSSKRQCAGN